MQQVVITHKNGQALVSAITLGIEAEKIVSTKQVTGTVGYACEFVYAEADDRRLKPIVYQAANYKSQIDGFVSGTQVDLTVYNTADGTTSTLTVTEKFIEQVRDTTARINNTDTSCREVKFRKGAFTEEVVYVSNTLVSLATAAVTTTTAAVTTTTTTGA
ncbi:MAG: hypothetical protein JXR54_09925 [Tannerellaceae bacterium]|nr:hypothetical protein [Tannerellaceae bacterium]